MFCFWLVCWVWNLFLYLLIFFSVYLEVFLVVVVGGSGGMIYNYNNNVWFFVVMVNLGWLGWYGYWIEVIYDFYCNSWYLILFFVFLCSLNLYLMVVDGGLVCYFVCENWLCILFVCNLLMKFLWKLFLVLKIFFYISVLKMVMEDCVMSLYKVFVVGMVFGENGNDSLSMEVYDFVIDCWSMSGIILVSYYFMLSFLVGNVWCSVFGFWYLKFFLNFFIICGFMIYIFLIFF